ncbi:MAG: tetratricopeptide repeat protein [Elusimicrobiota bacterium]
MKWLNKYGVNIFLGVLVCVTALAYLPVLNNGFTNWDDNVLVTDNPLTKSLAPGNIIKIFTTFCNYEYRPLLYLSFAVEYFFVKLQPWLYHLTSLLLHLLNCILAFVFIYRLTNKNIITAGIAALIFALHPVQVQAVAWIAGRDDVLYTLFYLLSLIFYLRYIDTGGKDTKFYFLSLIMFFVSLFSKTLAVTVPLIMFLIDYFYGRKFTRNVLLEKVPFILGGIAVGVLAVVAQLSYEVPREKLMRYNFSRNVVGTFDDFVFYFNKIFYPNDLSCFYQDYKPAGGQYFSVFLVFAILLGIGFTGKFTKKVIFGSAFFLMAILPVLKLTTGRPTSDHRLYLSLLGVAYLVGELISWITLGVSYRMSWVNKLKNMVVVVLITAVTVTFTYLTNERVKVWKDSLTLWNDALEKNPRLALGYSNRAQAYLSVGEFDKAAADCEKMAELTAIAAQFSGPVQSSSNKNIGNTKKTQSPQEVNAIAYNNHGVVMFEKGEYGLAVQDYTKAIELNEKAAEGYANRGAAYQELGKFELAFRDYEQTIKLDPTFAPAYYNRGKLYLKFNRLQDAVREFTEAIKYRGDYYESYANRGDAFLDLREYEAAIKDYTTVLRFSETARTYNRRGAAYSMLKQYDKALHDFRKAEKLAPGLYESYYNIGLMNYQTRKYPEAIDYFTEALVIEPGLVDAYKNRGNCYFEQRKFNNAFEDYDKAVKLDPEDLSLYQNRAFANYHLGRFPEALKDALFLQSRGYSIEQEFIDELSAKIGGGSR